MALAKWPLLLVIYLIGALILVKSLEYYQPDFSRGYLAHKREVFDGVFRWGLYAHIVGAPLLLFIGGVQLFFRYEYRRPAWHRWLGRGYMLLVLGLAAPGGLIMARYAIGGTWGQVNFYLLDLLWIICTALAWYAIRKGHMVYHRRWVNRSYILALSAVNLRLLGFVFAYYFAWRDVEAYLWAAWLSWLPFLLAYELIWRGNAWWKARKISGSPR